MKSCTALRYWACTPGSGRRHCTHSCHRRCGWGLSYGEDWCTWTWTIYSLPVGVGLECWIVGRNWRWQRWIEDCEFLTFNLFFHWIARWGDDQSAEFKFFIWYSNTLQKTETRLREELKLWLKAKETAGGKTLALWLTRYANNSKSLCLKRRRKDYIYDG